MASYDRWQIEYPKTGGIYLRKQFGDANVLIKVFKEPRTEFFNKPNYTWADKRPSGQIHISMNGKMVMSPSDFDQLVDVLNKAFLELDDDK